MPHTTGRLVSTLLIWLGSSISWLPGCPSSCVHNYLLYTRYEDDQQSCDPHDRRILERHDLWAKTLLPAGRSQSSRSRVPRLLQTLCTNACAEGERGLGYAVGTVNCSLSLSFWGPEMLSVSNVRGKIAISAFVGAQPHW